VWLSQISNHRPKALTCKCTQDILTLVYHLSIVPSLVEAEMRSAEHRGPSPPSPLLCSFHILPFFLESGAIVHTPPPPTMCFLLNQRLESLRARFLSLFINL